MAGSRTNAFKWPVERPNRRRRHSKIFDSIFTIMTNKMNSRKVLRHGSSTRLTILVVFLIIVGIGCIFEFTYARPQFQAAWEEIKTIDGSADSGEYTSEKVEKLIGKKPVRIDENMHDDCVVHTYRWRSGLLVKNHDIHVVYTKLKKGIEKLNPKYKGRVYYFSASAGQPLDPIENFPLEKESIVINLNPPQIMGGGIPGGDSSRRKKGDGKKKGSDGKGDKAGDDKKGDKKEASDKGETSDQEKSDNKSEKEADESNQEKDSDVEKSEADDPKESDESEVSDEKKADEKKSDEKTSDEKKASEEAGEESEGGSDKKDG